MPNISIVIITFNEASNIERCILAAQQLSSDIVVVDSYSSDETEVICKKMGVRFFQKKWIGYSDQKNYGNSKAEHDWILSIDADEELSPELIANIKTLFDKSVLHDAYNINFITRYCGKWIKHGKWYPEKHTRLFNKKSINWNQNEVHEGLSISNDHNVGKLKGLIRHYTINSIGEHLQKVNHYSTLGAEKMFRKGKRASFIKLYISPFVRFIVDYFFRLGFLDGFQGFCIAMITAHESFLKYAKLREIWNENK